MGQPTLTATQVFTGSLPRHQTLFTALLSPLSISDFQGPRLVAPHTRDMVPPYPELGGSGDVFTL